MRSANTTGLRLRMLRHLNIVVGQFPGSWPGVSWPHLSVLESRSGRGTWLPLCLTPGAILCLSGSMLSQCYFYSSPGFLCPPLRNVRELPAHCHKLSGNRSFLLQSSEQPLLTVR